MDAPAREELNMEKDIWEKNCLSVSERYADLINGLLLEEKQVVKSQDLQKMDTQASTWNLWGRQKKRSYRLISRDIIKKVAWISQTL